MNIGSKGRSVLFSLMVILIPLIPTGSTAQTIVNSFCSSTPATHALIVGISDYKHLKDLQFADRDAQVFRKFLVQTMDSRKDTNNIVMLLNEEAVSPLIYKALEDLVSLVCENDKVYIYFSGHGDSENTTIFRSGFLLTHDTPHNSYYTNSLNVDILNHFIHTLSVQNKADVTFIADACRSGELGSGANSGVAQTARALAGNVADEVRVLSCQPNEVSLEGVQWGNGRGLFSYHLVNALYGMADAEATSDGKISLNELNIYLSTNVPRDANPVNQYPGIYGPMNKIVGHVNPELMLIVEQQEKMTSPSNYKDASSRAYEDRFLSKLDSVQLTYYYAFNRSVMAGKLQAPKNDNAYYYLNRLEETNANEILQNLLLRKLIAELQSESQLFIDQLADLSTRWHYRDMKYGKWAKNLELSADLLGEDHYLYQTTLGKYYFFNAANLYYKSQQGNAHMHPEEHIRKSLDMINKAIEADELVTYYHNLKGVLINQLNYPRQAITIFDEAIRLNPEYPYSYANKSWALIKTGEFEAAIEHCNSAINLDPSYHNAYQYKITALKKLGKQEEAMMVYRELMRISNPNIGL